MSNVVFVERKDGNLDVYYNNAFIRVCFPNEKEKVKCEIENDKELEWLRRN